MKKEGGRVRQNDKGSARTRTNESKVDQSRTKSMVDDHRPEGVDQGMRSTNKGITVYLNHGHYHISSYFLPNL